MANQIRRDVRTPADPQDFETEVKRSPRPPKDAKWVSDANGDTLKIFEWDEVRPDTVSYRIYFLSNSQFDALASYRGLLGGFRASRLVTSVSTSSRGESIQVPLLTFPVVKGVAGSTVNGWAFIVGVNRFGDESDPLPVKIVK